MEDVLGLCQRRGPRRAHYVDQTDPLAESIRNAIRCRKVADAISRNHSSEAFVNSSEAFGRHGSVHFVRAASGTSLRVQPASQIPHTSI
jgi:hypothetical protein